MKLSICLCFLIVEGAFAGLLATKPSGTVLFWGANRVLGTTPDVFQPGESRRIQIGGASITNAVAIAAGGTHALALRSDGTVVGWGYNQEGQALGYAIKSIAQTNGLVFANNRPLIDIIYIASGWDHNIAVQRGGAVIAWGNGRGGCTKVPARLDDVVSVSAGWSKSLALRSTGDVIGWGETSVPSGLSNIVYLSEGGDNQERGLAVTKAGFLKHWGVETLYADATPPIGLDDVVAVAAGINHSLALKRNGTVFGWGFNQTGAATGVPNKNPPYVSAGLVMINGSVLNNVASIAASRELSLALTKDGEVKAWGNNRLSQLDIPHDVTNICAVSAGDGFCLAIKKD